MNKIIKLYARNNAILGTKKSEYLIRTFLCGEI
nr:MAG TPA: hypothetical protein [Caudoviricetes sp.]